MSGHYYFHDFYCADSGSLPALLILELVSLEGSTLSQLLEPYRSNYFISGEINSEVSDQQGKLEELRRATATASSSDSTASPSTTTIGISTYAHRTPNRCCGYALSRCARARTWSAAATKCSR